MTRTRVRRRRLAAVVLVVGGWALGGPVAGAVGLGREAPSEVGTYVVRPGDTLWSIATALRPDADPRRVVYDIGRANDLDPGALVPGREILIPSAA